MTDPTPSTGWLLELPQDFWEDKRQGQATYLRAPPDISLQSPQAWWSPELPEAMCWWTHDPQEALRFARKVDAESYMAAHWPAYHHIAPVEHSWPATAAINATGYAELVEALREARETIQGHFDDDCEECRRGLAAIDAAITRAGGDL